MKHKKRCVIAIVLLIIIVSIAGGKIRDIEAFSAKYEKSQNNSKIVYQENMQTYEAEDGTHTIYWAQGITPPKMTNDKNLQGQKGYFSLENIEGYETYSAEFEPGKGYYDYNKNLDTRGDEHPLCYLGAASNLISWWLEQNQEYVNEYVRRLENTNIYGHIDGLYPVVPFNKTVWEEMRAQPGIELQQGYLAQKLGKSNLVTKLLSPYYYKKDDGYFADLVLDFFFNGYDAIPSLEYIEQNSEDKFHKDPRGGFFFPIFGKTRIAERLTGSQYNSYDYISKNLRKMFAEGKGVSFGYEVGALNAHAITVWGAEYDQNNNLRRVFITDSDDFQPAKKEDEYWRGMVGFNTVKDKNNGRLCLTNNTNITSSKPGNYINDIVTVDLAQDIWEERLRDESGPKDPQIIKELDDKIYAKGANVELEITAVSNDSGYLEYEWYVSDTKNSKGNKIVGENKNKIKINTKELGDKYYYCVVKNIKNGKAANTETKHAKISVQDIELVNAEAPKIDFKYGTIKFKQYAPPYYPEVKVEASVSDGGTLSYQWFQALDNSATNGRKLEGETKPILYPPTNHATEGGLFYYCEVTNTNENVTGNSKTTVRTPYSKRVIIEARELIDAQEPLIMEEPIELNIKQFDKNKELKVEAKLFDGGTLSYQWYEVNPDYTTKLLKGETNPILRVDTSITGNKMYKCELINNNDKAKNNKEKRIFTRTVAVNISGEGNISHDNTLRDISLKNSKLEPEFDSKITEYKAYLEHGVDQLKLEAYANDNNAKVTIDNPIIYIGQTKDVKITVEAENHEIKIYTIKVTRSGEHDFNQWQITKKPTCTEKGSEKHVCKICGQEETREIPEKAHEFEKTWTIDKEATCQTEGSKSHHCKVCGEKSDITTIEKKAHEYGKWIESENKEWKYQRTCRVCGEIEYKEKNQENGDIIEKPENNKPETENPEVEKPENNKPETEKPEVEKPENNKPETEKPEVEKPENNKPETENLENKNEADKRLPMTGLEDDYIGEELEIEDSKNYRGVISIGILLVVGIVLIRMVNKIKTKGKRSK